ncbi:MAG TPA: tyrosine--tRNA ligase [Solirubrobacteraceae bacterium]|nr:tyrosine--tRNA ligase [Solirubrobacteraceae bacterium]
MSSADHEPTAEPPATRGTPDRQARGPASRAGDRTTHAVPADLRSAGQLAARLHKNAVDSLPEGALAEKLSEARRAGRPLRVKLGIDPTAPDIHLGHAVVLRKLRELQDAGQLVVLIVGDYTARVGDPSGRSALRPMLSAQEIAANAATFREQALRILDPDPARLEVRFNSEWLDMPMAELLRLVGTTTVAQLLERDDFAQRYSARAPISMLELLYPLLQGYDSVAVRSDLELGGTDQKFNLLLGRDIQRAYGQPSQAILTMPLLVGVEGRRKMSKSLGNHIGITEPPAEIYGKTMSIPDEVVGDYFRLLLSREPAAGAAPRDAKRELARGIVSWLYSPEAAEAAEAEFDLVFVHRRAPGEMPEARVAPEQGVVHLPAVIAEEFGFSRAHARRLIDQGAVSLGEVALESREYDAPVERADGQVLRVGKRRFRRLVVE